MSHSHTITLIADQEIEFNYETINIYNIETIFLNSNGTIEEIIHNKEPTKEEIEQEAYDDAEWKHIKSEGYRKAYYKKNKWKFYPKPFIYKGKNYGIISYEIS